MRTKVEIQITHQKSYKSLTINIILWSPDAKSQLIGKDPDAVKDKRQEEKGIIEDEVVGWHQ